MREYILVLHLTIHLSTWSSKAKISSVPYADILSLLEMHECSLLLKYIPCLVFSEKPQQCIHLHKYKQFYSLLHF